MSEAAAPSSAPAGASASSRRPRRLPLRLIGVLIFLAGSFSMGYSLGIGLFSGHKSPPSHGEVSEEPDHPEEAPERIAQREEFLQIADNHLGQHAWTQARKVLERIKAIDKNLKNDVAFRIALTLEGQGDWDEAIISYRAIEPTSLHDPWPVLARLGQSRCLLQTERPDEGRNLLAPYLLSPPLIEGVQGLPTEIERLWRLLIQASRGLGGFKLRAEFDWFPLSPFVIPGPANSEGIGLGAKSLVDRSKQKNTIIFATDEFNKEPTLSRVIWRGGTVREFFAALAAAGKVKIEVSPKAMVDRTIAIDQRQVNLADLLDRVADAYDLLALQSKSGWRLVNIDEAPTSERWAALDRIARSTVRILADSEGIQTIPMAAILADQAADEGNAAEASNYLRQITESPSELTPIAYYNQGILDAKVGNYNAARRWLLRMIDQDPDHPLAPLCHLRLCRLAYEDDNFRTGILHARRALTGSLSPPPSFHRMNAVGMRLYPYPEATAGLAVVHWAAGVMMLENPAAAKEVLVKNKNAIKGAILRPSVRYLNALADFEIAGRNIDQRREARPLLEAYFEDNSPKVLGPLGLRLQFRTAKAFHLWQDMITPEIEKLESAPGPGRFAFRYARAEAYYWLNRLSEAEMLWRNLEAEAAEPWATSAKIQIAALDLRANRLADAARRCEELRNGTVVVDQQTLFRIWGETYRRLGDDANAIRCFAGEPPVPTK